jgi:hypothetical protein
MVWSRHKVRLERLAIGEALWSLAEKLWATLPQAVLSAVGVSVMAAWEWAASQGWGFLVVLGVALGYAMLGLFAAVRRLVWPRPAGTTPTAEAAPSPSPAAAAVPVVSPAPTDQEARLAALAGKLDAVSNDVEDLIKLLGLEKKWQKVEELKDYAKKIEKRLAGFPPENKCEYLLKDVREASTYIDRELINYLGHNRDDLSGKAK